MQTMDGYSLHQLVKTFAFGIWLWVDSASQHFELAHSTAVSGVKEVVLDRQ